MARNNQQAEGGLVKTQKSNKSARRSDDKQGKGGGKKPETKPTKVIRARGDKPDFTPKEKRLQPRESNFSTSINKLCNGFYDADHYLIDNVEFRKEMHPMYKDASTDTLFIVAYAIPDSHPLALSGVQPGTRIPSFQAVKPFFVSNMKNLGVKEIVEKLWKFLRNAGATSYAVNADPVPEFVQETQEKPEIIKEPLEIEREPSAVARILWNGSRLGLVERNGVTFEVREMTKGIDRIVHTIHVKSAPVESGLLDAELSHVYVTLGQLRVSNFDSSLEGKARTAQNALHSFLRNIMKEEDLLEVTVKPTAAKKKYFQAPIDPDEKVEFQTRPLRDMIAGRQGFYDLTIANLVIKMYGPSSAVDIEVMRIDPDHQLCNADGVKVGMQFSAKYIAEGTESIKTLSLYGAVTAVTSLIRTKLIECGAVKGFKKLGQFSEKKTAPKNQQEPGKVKLRLAASEGSVIDDKPVIAKLLERGFMSAPVGEWLTSEGVRIKGWSTAGTFCVKVKDSPANHPLHGYTPFIKVFHMKFPENGSIGHELREHLRKELRAIGELPEEAPSTVTTTATTA